MTLLENSLKHLSIPTMNAFRNCTVATTAVGEWILFGNSISVELLLLLLLMVSGPFKIINEKSSLKMSC